MHGQTYSQTDRPIAWGRGRVQDRQIARERQPERQQGKRRHTYQHRQRDKDRKRYIRLFFKYLKYLLLESIISSLTERKITTDCGDTKPICFHCAEDPAQLCIFQNIKPFTLLTSRLFDGRLHFWEDVFRVRIQRPFPRTFFVSSPRFCKFESSTTSDWLNCMIKLIRGCVSFFKCFVV